MPTRRTFLKGVVAGGVAAGWASSSRAADRSEGSQEPFRMRYAPHFGMFENLAGADLVDQLKFAADQGFRAWEDNSMRTRSVADQTRVAAAMNQLGMEWGTISALNAYGHQLHFASDDRAARDKVVSETHAAVEVARRVGSKRMTLILGTLDPKLPMVYQTANCIDLLHRVCDVVEPHGIVLVMEPLNRWKDHPDRFLDRASQGYMLCRAVRRPSCKVLFDIYHEQIAEGNLWPNIERAWDEIGYFQCADNPGRKEPGTGEINYRFLFQRLADRGFRGVMGMEHGNAMPGAEGERAVMAAYRAVDPHV